MTNATNTGSAAAGSPVNVPVNPNNPGAATGQTGGAATETVPKSIYDQLESKLGTQGNELGQYKEFFKSITPLLDKLEQAPDLVQAIVDGKVTGELAKAVLDGKVQINDATVVAQAAAAVQGNPDNQGKSAAEVEKLIEASAEMVGREFVVMTELQSFDDQTKQFIENTVDFPEYADEIGKWLDSHDVTDIRIAYYAVKGELSESAAKKAAESASGEVGRNVAANAAGGNSPAQYAHNDQKLVDQLISGRPNPNNLGI